MFEKCLHLLNLGIIVNVLQIDFTSMSDHKNL